MLQLAVPSHNGPHIHCIPHICPQLEGGGGGQVLQQCATRAWPFTPGSTLHGAPP